MGWQWAVKRLDPPRRFDREPSPLAGENLRDRGLWRTRSEKFPLREQDSERMAEGLGLLRMLPSR
jgi:hypothetical protein